MHPVRIAVALLALYSTGARSQAPVATGMAVRATRAPELDGRDDDEVWRLAPVIDRGWRQFDPAEDGEPTLRTEAKVAYDDRNLYVLVRAYDPRPDSIVSLLSRRDVRTNSDQIKIIIDAYHDRRTGVEFAVSPGGVKRDASIYNDVIEDLSWDGVWDAGTRVDSLGWIAEFRIPFSQLRFGKKPAHTFGFGIWRDVARSNERISWPVFRQSRPTLASQLGELNGIADISRSGRLELLPYVVTKNITEQVGPSSWDHPQKITAGADIKYGVTSTMTLDATVNPDFGQVEADPAVLNLTAFEVRFEERRPFFQEGVGLFRCNGPCEGIFYTRRIGRVPQLRTNGADPTFTSILGAAKLTGRLGNGLSVGLVEAVTSREVGARGTVEPQTNYLVGRIYKELRQGRSGVGAMLTGVNRDLDPSTEDLLRRDAYTLLFQGFHRFAGERFEIMGYSGLNRVTGTEEAIARTQLSSVHLFQRPDHEERFDPTRTSLEGVVAAVQFQKLGGTVQYSTFLRNATPSAELNDLGFVTLVNSRSMRNNVSMRTSRPGSFYRRLQADVGTYSDWTTGGLQQAMSANASVFAELTNSWQTYATVGVENIGATHCVSCARGGPALRLSPTNQFEMGVDGDRRRVLIPHLYYRYSRGDDGRSQTHGSSASVDYRLASRFSMSIGAVYDRVTDDQQWLDNYDDPIDGTSNFTFARMRNTTASITSRLNFTATNTLSFQLYLQPFVSTGAFSNWRELDQPRASDRDERFRPFTGAGPVSDFDFNSKQFNSNLVARWEYRPGSTLFVVWQQGRFENELNPGSFRFGRDYRNLFGAHPDNVLLLKASYWLGL